ncbi:MAG: hypothetical protein JKY22_00330 [Flavobacteriaceae bacterium]|nr:hypothetical protein [Flavobacteriaceae bacterium]
MEGISPKDLILPPPYALSPSSLAKEQFEKVINEKLRSSVPGDMAVTTDFEKVRNERHRDLMSSVVYEGFAQDSIESYNNWIGGSLSKQITNRSILLPNGDYIRFKDVSIYPPTMTIKTVGPDGQETSSEKIMYPSTAREMSKTYSLSVYARLEQIDSHGNVVGILHKDQDKLIPLCSIPLMLGSRYCSLYGMSDDQKLRVFECPHDPLGYFIINGGEKLLLLRDQLRVAKPLVYIDTNRNKIVICRITSWTLSGTTVVDIHKNKSKHLYEINLYFLGNKRGVTGTICVMQIMRILWEMSGGSNPDAFSFIEDVVKFTKSKWRDTIRRELYVSAVYTNSQPDDIATVMKSKGKRVYTQENLKEFNEIVNSDIMKGRKLKHAQTSLKEREEQFEDTKRGIYNDLFVHIDEYVESDEYSTFDELNAIKIRRGSLKKYYLLCCMVARLAEYKVCLRPLDDRDDWENKQITLPGKTLEKRFWLVWRKSILAKMRKRAKDMHVDVNNIKRVIKHGNVTNKLIKSFTANEWTHTKGNDYGKESVSVELDRTSHMSVHSQHGKINTPTNRRAKQKAIRQIIESQIGFVGLAETPEGQQCGLVKQKAITCMVSQDRNPEIVRNFLVTKQLLSNVYDVTNENMGPCMHDGNFIGWCNVGETRKELLEAKRNGTLKHDTSITIDGVVLYVYSNAGRPTRPLLVVGKNGKTVIENKNKWGESFRELTRNGSIEYVDPSEQNKFILADTLGTLVSKSERDSTLANLQRDLEKIRSGNPLYRNVKKIDFNDNPYEEKVNLTELRILKEINIIKEYEIRSSNLKFDYCELDPNALLGVNASLIPLPNHDPAARNSYQCHMGKQSLGIFHSNQDMRFDTSSRALISPRGGLFNTQSHNWVGLDDMPSGDMVICAIMTQNGENQEDGISFSKAAIEAGLFRYTINKKHESVLKSDTSKGITEVFGVPVKRDGHPEGAYDFLDENGIAKVGSMLKRGHCIIGKTRIRQMPDGTVMEKDASVYVERGSEGIVDMVISPTPLYGGGKVIKVNIRSTRVPIVGDKFASRHAQKGVISSMVNKEDLPFTSDGITPDVIINPHAIPGRMTIGKIIEIITSKVTATTGEKFDATAFRNFDADEIANELRKNGYSGSGKEIMYNGITGEPFEVMIFIGPCLYQSLKHFVADKISARGKGPLDKSTRQPIGGRSRGGDVE